MIHCALARACLTGTVERKENVKHPVALLSVFVVILAGCPSVPQSPSGVSALRDVGGVVVHMPSGMQFPPLQGEFRRSSVRQYDAAGRDVNAGYDSPSALLPIAVTVYVYPSPPIRSFGSPQNVIAEAKSTLARREFRRVMNEIKQAHQDVRLMSEGEVSAPASAEPTSGHFGHVAYTADFAGRVRPVESLTYVFCYVGEEWTVKYRITYPAGANARPAIDQFLQSLKWTIRRPNQSPQLNALDHA